MERTQFTFYRSYFEAVTSLPKKDQNSLFLAICSYALDEKEPNLTGTAKAIFSLVRPTLDASRKKAASGHLGGSKPKANEKQNESKTKAKAKLEIEQEIEQEIVIEQMLKRSAFDDFWAAYPKKTGKGEARKAFAKVKVPVEKLIAAVENQKRSVQWQKDGGQYIPNPSTWLNQGRWEDELLVNTASMGYTHEEAVVDDLAFLRQQLGMERNDDGGQEDY